MANSNPTFVNDMNLFGSHIKQIPCIVGEGSPTSDTYGAVGMLYMDSSSNGGGEMWKCIEVSDTSYTWKKLVGEDSGENPPQDGEDGFSPIAIVTQIAEGATISITDKNGTTTATVTNGKDGKDGVDGQDGYTPQMGVDYWTPTEKAEMVNAVIAALPKYTGEVAEV